MKNAKVFKSGNSQAIRLPKEYRLDVDSVQINKIGNLLVLIPKDNPWANFIDGVNEADEFPNIDNKGLILKSRNLTLASCLVLTSQSVLSNLRQLKPALVQRKLDE